MSEENKTPETTKPETASTEETVNAETPAEAAKTAPEATTSAAPETPAASEQAPAPAAPVAPPAAAEKPAAPAKPAPAAKPAAPAKEEEPAPPDPRVILAEERLELVRNKITSKFGESVIEAAEVKKFQPTLLIKNENWVEVVEFVKTEPSLAFQYPECMAGTDYKEHIEVYTLLHSFELDWDLVLKVRTPRDQASVPSITSLFSGFNWEEREIYDLLGVDFPGHPDMRRIMLVDEWQGHPLRKDYVVKD